MSEPGSDATELAAKSDIATARTSLAVFGLILAVALCSLYFFYSRGLSNLYGDGIAHVEGARRLFDSLTPGYPEIGSAWLPLYHILASPLALNGFLWKTGLAGSIVSAAAYGVTAWFLFRLALGMSGNLAAGWVALGGFLFCPAMAYLASTPLTEPLALMWAVLIVYNLYLYQQRGEMRLLVAASIAAFLGTLTRYDGWFLLPFAALFVLLARKAPWMTRFRHAAVFCVISGLGPILWFLHNRIRFGNALEFYNGPYSAWAIYQHQLATTGFRYPTDGSLLLSGRYFLADLTLVIGMWPLELAVLGLVAWAVDSRERRRRSAALLFLVPFVFYVQSMAHAAVPIYVPTLFPFTYYNLRYGIEMLPAAAIFPSFLLSSRRERRLRVALTVVILGIIVGQAASFLTGGVRNLPVVAEAIANTPCKSKSQEALIHFFRFQYDNQPVLVAAGKWPCLMPQVGIPFRQTVSETNRKYWKQLRYGADKWAEWIIRGDDDVVDELMRAYPQAFSDFDLVERDQFPGEGSVVIYRRRKG